jgi:hypothetical protein
MPTLLVVEKQGNLIIVIGYVAISYRMIVFSIDSNDSFVPLFVDMPSFEFTSSNAVKAQRM